MPNVLSPAVARDAATIIERAWIDYIESFHHLTRQARVHFDARDWGGIQRDGAARLDLYITALSTAIAQLDRLLGHDLRVRTTWAGLKHAYLERVSWRSDAELAETFFNSVTRRLFVTVGVDPAIEFVTSALEAMPSPRADHPPVTMTCPVNDSVARAVEQLLGSFRGAAPFSDFERDTRVVSDALVEMAAGHLVTTLEFARAPFFRNKAMYLVGRAHTLAAAFPIAIACVHTSAGLAVDAVLTEVDDISIVFSFARSYFIVDTACPSALVTFLRELMPRKPISELYASIGHNKHGKTEFYRALLSHLDTTDERFEIAPGARGMVMVVFTMPGFDAVFKIIRDRFEPPKTATRADVREKYEFVFRHDRAGRLVDAQEFEHLRFDRRAVLAGALLDELAAKAAGTVAFEAAHRRLRPPLHRTAAHAAGPVPANGPPAHLARAAVHDYGRRSAIWRRQHLPGRPADQELRRVTPRAGDLLRLRRAVPPVGLPVPADAALARRRRRALGEPWFHVSEGDIFPEEFLTFLGLTGELRGLFAQVHGDLLTPEFWLEMQAEHRAGHLPDIWPYPPTRRVRR